MAVTSKAAGSSKFLQGTKGQTGVVEAIEAGIAHRVSRFTPVPASFS